MSISAKIVADSLSSVSGDRLTTIQVRMHRFMLPELTRHRMFSFSVASNRAIPTKKIIDEVENNPAMPLKFGKNKPGMQAAEFFEADSGLRYGWEQALNDAVRHARWLYGHGVHKQSVNRLLEPFQWCDLIITGTQWQNFFNLRIDQEAQPEIQEVALQIKDVMDSSTPQELSPGEWHLPYLTEKNSDLSLEDKKAASAARCARVSYKQHDKSDPDVEKDLNLAARLENDWHLSPFEAQATPMRHPDAEKGCNSGEDLLGYTHVDKDLKAWSGNLKGWVQQRQLMEMMNEQ